MSIRETILSTKLGWRAWKLLHGSNRDHKLVADYIRPLSGERILDVGCGNGDISSLIFPAHYVGIDFNPRYIADARRLYGKYGEFHVANVSELPDLGLTGFDKVILVGVLHHLSDEEIDALLSALPSVLATGGKVLSFDATFVPDQALSARLMAAGDRGRYVREPRRYKELVSNVFRDVSDEVRHDLYRYPFSICVVQGSV